MTCADRYLHKLFSSLCRSLFYFPADIIINDACLQNIEHFHLIISFKEFEEAVFKLAYFIQRYILQQAMRAAIKDCNLLFHRHRSVLRLYQQTGVLLPLVDSQCSYRVHVAAEFGECLQFAILCLIYLQCTGHFLHRLNLSITAHTTDGDTHINGRTITLIKEVGVEEYLSVGNGNHIRRDIG